MTETCDCSGSLAKTLPFNEVIGTVAVSHDFGNALTLQLAREETINSRITSIYGPFDPHIPEGSILPGATNIELPTAGHFRILGDPETARIIVEQLNPDEP